MKVALVHDYLTRFGGAERVLLALAAMFPKAPIYCLLYDEQKMGRWFGPERVRPSFLQKFPRFLRTHHKYLLPLLPSAPETFDLREFDLVISSSSAFAKGVVTRPKTIHINYCHNPARFLWDYSFDYLKEQDLGFFRRVIVKLSLNYLRLWDRSASLRVDHFLANSKNTAERIQKYYRREAEIIYPPVRMSQFETTSNAPAGNFQKLGLTEVLSGQYFLIVSQLTPYKKIDVAVEAFNKLELPLVIIGEGPQKAELQKIAKENVKIIGWQSDKAVSDYYKNCFAFIFPGEDDFGITPIEAMSYGKPVLALKAGGAMETVLPGITGELFEAAIPEVLADGVRRLRENYSRFSPLVIRKWAERFSEERFRRQFMEFVRRIRYNESNPTGVFNKVEWEKCIKF